MTRKNKRVKKKISNYIIFMGIFSYIIYNLVISIMNTGIQTYTVKKGQLMESMPERGVMVRTEQVFYSNAQGVPKYLFKEGERMGSNKNVCEVQISLADKKLKEEADTIQRRIDIMETGMVYSPNVLTPEKLDRMISVKKHEIKNSFMSGNLIVISRLKKEMLYLMDQKSILYGSFSSAGNKGSITSKITAIRNQMESSTKFIKNTFPGELSLSADGYEIMLKPDRLGELNSQVLNEVQNRNRISKGKDVNEGDPVFKIVNNHYWYMVFVLEQEEAEQFKKGKGIYIKNEEDMVYGVIKEIYKDKYGKYIMVFKTNSSSAAMHDDRVHEVDIILKNLNGIKIPQRAVIEKDEKKGVYVISETGVAVFKELNCILGENDEYVILDYKKITRDKVKTVNLYDEIILNPGKVKEGRRIR